MNNTGLFNWQINIAEILVVVAAAFVLYGRIVKLETKLEPLWCWWTRQLLKRIDNEAQQIKHESENLD